MKKGLLTLLAIGLPAFGFADATPTAAVTAAPKAAAIASPAPAATAAVSSMPRATQAPTAAATPKPVPTPKPLYVDYQPPDWAKGWDHITLAEAEKLHKRSNVLFLDARAYVEYQAGHIPGALPLPTGEADKYYTMYESEIKHAKKLVTYCHGIGCRLSEKSAKFLVDKGYKNVAVFFGGWPQWNDAKLPVESGDSKAPKAEPAPLAASVPQPISPTAAVAKAAAVPKAEAKPVSPAAK